MTRGAWRRGEAVRVRGERWRVVHVTSHEACDVVDLAGAERANAGCTGRFLFPFEPVDRLPLPLDRPRPTAPATWRRTVRAILADAMPAWGSLRAAARANVVLLPYQLEPALAMTRGLACRVLLADEVGLGKTIQAGLIVAELLAREPDARVLIVTPASLREQWRDELLERFAILADVIDAAALARAAGNLSASVNPWSLAGVAIASIDFLKRADVIRSLEPLTWDLVAFDEAHALAGRSDRAVAADLVAGRARRVAIITATPHSGDDAAFERLRALGRVGPHDHLLTFRRSRVEAGVPRTRVMRQLAISPTRQEARMHRALAAYAAVVSQEAPAERSPAAGLAMLVLARRASSSASSLTRSVERRLMLLGAAGHEGGEQIRLPLEDGHLADDEEPADELAAPGLSDQGAEHRWLQEILALARAVTAESKIGALRRLLRRTSEPAIVFTEYRDTLRHVASELSLDAAILHGGMTTSERAGEVRRFTHGSARLLLATDAASEGLNLHPRCRLVVNLDVPWTPLRLEQRVGRVDRLGQRRRVHSVTFVAARTHDVIVASGLTARSMRAERGAPFDSTSGHAGLLADARAEATRLTLVRRLIETRGSRANERPALTVSRPQSRSADRGLCLALRLLFVDADGAVVWETVRGFRLSGRLRGPRNRRSSSMRSWFQEAVSERASELAAASTVVHERELSLLRSEMQAAVAPLVAREHAILERLQGGRARLAAPLLQPGLFDRRALREADAQRRVAEEAATRARDRISLLRRQCDLRAGERWLAFAVTWFR